MTSIVALDASYRGCGIASFRFPDYHSHQAAQDSDLKPILVLGVISCSEDASMKGFHTLVPAVGEIVVPLRKLFHRVGGNGQVIMEMPPPRGRMAPALWALDTAIARAADDFGLSVTGCSPILVKSVLGSKKAKKEESCKLVKEQVGFFDETYEMMQFSLGGELTHPTMLDEMTLPLTLDDNNIADALIIGLTYIAMLGKYGRYLPPPIANNKKAYTFRKVF